LVVFTYHSPLVRKITSLFKNTDITIAFRASNTIYKQQTQKAENNNPSGIYAIKCNTCNMNNVGQSGRHIATRHTEHIRYIRNNNPVSAYATQILTFTLLMWRIGRATNSIPLYSYIQQDAKSHSLFISGNCSTCFGWYFHPSSVAHTTVSTASGICHNVTAICRYRGRVGTGLIVLWVAYATHSTIKPVPTLPR
jgi:hypothetical protein